MVERPPPAGVGVGASTSPAAAADRSAAASSIAKLTKAATSACATSIRTGVPLRRLHDNAASTEVAPKIGAISDP